MAREKTDTASTLVEQIEQGIAILREKRQEIRQLEAQAAQLANSGNVEGSIAAEERVVAITKFCTRQRANIEALILARKQEQYTAHCHRIDELYARKVEEAKQVGEQLRQAAKEYFEVATRLKNIGSGNLSGTKLLEKVAVYDLGDNITGLLRETINGLGRGCADLRSHAGNKEWFPRNPLDGFLFATLRQELPDITYDTFTIEEPEPAEFVTVANDGSH